MKSQWRKRQRPPQWRRVPRSVHTHPWQTSLPNRSIGSLCWIGNVAVSVLSVVEGCRPVQM
ncbi:hypothetical protein FJK96_10555 [Mycobacteroides chelonae]|uniref:Uncharacterized protein n=1 Tax=Mycobacteroides chelonae TaxID=1774 RepID=A0AB73U115_MYCCH|nr:hypothetical protein FJK96_10555 [Mycobacteroides chelonae]